MVGVAGPDIALASSELISGQLTWRENRLTDVFCVIVHSLIQNLGVHDHVTRHNVSVVVAEERIQEVVASVCLVTDVLLPTEGVEAVVLWAITAQELPVAQLLHRL